MMLAQRRMNLESGRAHGLSKPPVSCSSLGCCCLYVQVMCGLTVLAMMMSFASAKPTGGNHTNTEVMLGRRALTAANQQNRRIPRSQCGASVTIPANAVPGPCSDSGDALACCGSRDPFCVMNSITAAAQQSRAAAASTALCRTGWACCPVAGGGVIDEYTSTVRQPGAVSASAQEMYEELMRHRAAHGLPRIPLCNHLNTVAAVKVQDNQANPPSGRCNLHSWSESPRWSGCCYTADHSQGKCMWDKPRELTAYKGDGFEISHAVFGARVTPKGAVDGWKGSPGHNDVILNRGTWRAEWHAIGVGISEGYAVAWFGKEPCPA
jgi:uncharacterized protein YkwD